MCLILDYNETIAAKLSAFKHANSAKLEEQPISNFKL